LSARTSRSQRAIRRGTQDAGVAEAFRTLLGGGVDPFDDALDIPVACDHAAVPAWVRGAECEQRQRCIAGGATFQQAVQRIGPDQRIVSVQDGHLAGAELRHSHQRGMRRAAAILLHHAGVWRGFPADRLHFRPDHHDDAVEHLLAACQQVAQHGATGDLVQRLW
jgi:hypothetical protein